MTPFHRLVFVGFCAFAGLIVAGALFPAAAPFVVFVLSSVAAPTALFFTCAATGAAIAGAGLSLGIGRSGWFGGLLGLLCAASMTVLGAMCGSVLAVYIAQPVGVEVSGGVFLQSANFGILTLVLGLEHIWPVAIWLMTMAALHEIAKKLRAASKRPASGEIS